MDFLYLDNNCYQRSMDNQNNLEVYIETLACEEIFNRAKRAEVNLIWSFMNELEINLCHIPERVSEVYQLSKLCNKIVTINNTIEELSSNFHGDGFGQRDAVHLACAIYSRAKYLISCDKRFVNKARQNKYGIKVVNPIKYIRQEDY